MLDSHNASPTVNAEVSIPATIPNVVTNPSAPSAIDSATTPNVLLDVASVSASDKEILGRCPCAPDIYTTEPLAIVDPVPL